MTLNHFRSPFQFSSYEKKDFIGVTIDFHWNGNKFLIEVTDMEQPSLENMICHYYTAIVTHTHTCILSVEIMLSFPYILRINQLTRKSFWNDLPLEQLQMGFFPHVHSRSTLSTPFFLCFFSFGMWKIVRERESERETELKSTSVNEFLSTDTIFGVCVVLYLHVTTLFPSCIY